MYHGVKDKEDQTDLPRLEKILESGQLENNTFEFNEKTKNQIDNQIYNILYNSYVGHASEYRKSVNYFWQIEPYKIPNLEEGLRMMIDEEFFKNRIKEVEQEKQIELTNKEIINMKIDFLKAPGAPKSVLKDRWFEIMKKDPNKEKIDDNFMFETIFLMDKFYRIFLIFEIKHEDQLLNDSFFYYQKSEKIKNKERIEREERWRIEREEAGEEAGEEELPSADFGGGNRDVPEYIIGNLEEEIIEKLNDYPIIKDVYPGEQEQELKSEIKKIKGKFIYYKGCNMKPSINLEPYSFLTFGGFEVVVTPVTLDLRRYLKAIITDKVKELLVKYNYNIPVYAFDQQ